MSCYIRLVTSMAAIPRSYQDGHPSITMTALTATYHPSIVTSLQAVFMAGKPYSRRRSGLSLQGSIIPSVPAATEGYKTSVSCYIHLVTSAMTAFCCIPPPNHCHSRYNGNPSWIHYYVVVGIRRGRDSPLENVVAGGHRCRRTAFQRVVGAGRG
jgi:hypothetical protein